MRNARELGRRLKALEGVTGLTQAEQAVLAVRGLTSGDQRDELRRLREEFQSDLAWQAWLEGPALDAIGDLVERGGEDARRGIWLAAMHRNIAGMFLQPDRAPFVAAVARLLRRRQALAAMKAVAEATTRAYHGHLRGHVRPWVFTTEPASTAGRPTPGAGR